MLNSFARIVLKLYLQLPYSDPIRNCLDLTSCQRRVHLAAMEAMAHRGKGGLPSTTPVAGPFERAQWEGSTRWVCPPPARLRSSRTFCTIVVSHSCRGQGKHRYGQTANSQCHQYNSVVPDSTATYRQQTSKQRCSRGCLLSRVDRTINTAEKITRQQSLCQATAALRACVSHAAASACGQSGAQPCEQLAQNKT